MALNSPRLRELLRTSRCCHWCGIETFKRVPIPGQSLPPDTATVDHVACFHTAGSRQAQRNSETVLSCRQCNADRNDIVLKTKSGKALTPTQLAFLKRARANGHDVDGWLRSLEPLRPRDLTSNKTSANMNEARKGSGGTR